MFRLVGGGGGTLSIQLTETEEPSEAISVVITATVSREALSCVRISAIILTWYTDLISYTYTAPYLTFLSIMYRPSGLSDVK